MRFAVMTLWKHVDEHDWEEAQKSLDATDGVEGSTVTWFEVDENTQGSLFVLPSKEDYDEILESLTQMRQGALDEGSVLQVEAIGPVMAYREW